MGLFLIGGSHKNPFFPLLNGVFTKTYGARAD